jgi:acetyl-CoA hydrolase
MPTELLNRIRSKSGRSKIMKPEDTIPFFRNGIDPGWSALTQVGYPGCRSILKTTVP